jgi:aminotransferase
MLRHIHDRAKVAMQSDFREIMKKAGVNGCVNLGPGFCNMKIHPRVLEAAQRAIFAGTHHYTAADGLPELKAAIAKRYAEYNRMPVEPANVLVTSGATGGLESICKCFLEPGDEVVMFEPFYPYHMRQVVERQAVVRLVRLSPPNWAFSAEDLRRAITPRTKLLVMANPHNPTGKVFSRQELETIGAICRERGVIVVCDEVYEYLVTPCHPHISIASMPGMFDHTLTVSSAGKTFRVTGWRVGWIVGPADVMGPLGIKSDETYLCAPAPFQHAVAECLALPAEYFHELQSEFERKRARLIAALPAAGFRPASAEGAFYVLGQYDQSRYHSDVEAITSLIEDFGVLALPGSAFYRNAGCTGLLRFCFALDDDVVEKACERLAHPSGKARTLSQPKTGVEESAPGVPLDSRIGRATSA